VHIDVLNDQQKEYKSLQNYLALFEKKFKQRDIGHVLRSLVYFEEAELEHEIKTLQTMNWQELKRDFETRVKAIARQ